MSSLLAKRVQRIKPSPTLAVAARAGQLKAEGKDIINLGLGEPDFDTPEFIKQAAIKAIQEGFTKYTPVDGIPALKQAIIKKFARDNGLDYQPKQILVSCGAKQSIFNLAEALLNDGDEVIIPGPYWVSYPDIALLVGAKPVCIETSIEQHYKISPKQLEQAITNNTRLIFLNSPSNPSGMVYSKQELLALAEILKKHPQILIASDDIYEHIVWNNLPFNNILMVCPELYDRTIVINGVSKSYSMTGWRIGYAAGPVELIAAMQNIQSQSTSNPCSISQKAALAALEGDQTCVKEMMIAFKKRHDALCERLSNISGVKCLPADGTFYSFPSVQAAMDKLKISSDLEFAEKLLLETGVALVPGSAFGAPGCIRLSFAISMEKLMEAVDRIEKFITRK